MGSLKYFSFSLFHRFAPLPPPSLSLSHHPHHHLHHFLSRLFDSLVISIPICRAIRTQSLIGPSLFSIATNKEKKQNRPSFPIFASIEFGHFHSDFSFYFFSFSIFLFVLINEGVS